MKKNPRPLTSRKWDQFEKLTAENNEVLERLLKNKELKAKYSKVRPITNDKFYHLSFLKFISLHCGGEIKLRDPRS